MPPKRKKAAEEEEDDDESSEDATSKSSNIFDSMTFCLTGTLWLKRKLVEDIINKNGGNTSSSVNKKVTHVVSSEDEFVGTKSTKVLTAEGFGLPILKESFIRESVSNGRLVSATDAQHCWSTTGSSSSSSTPAPAKAKASSSIKSVLLTWLLTLKIPESDARQYSQIFSDNGFDSVNALEVVAEDDLRAMKFKLGHIRLIMNAVREASGEAMKSKKSRASDDDDDGKIESKSSLLALPAVAKLVDVCFSFDTTGSMYPCLTQVRRDLMQTCTKLLSEIPNIHISVIAHGDYCDEKSSYLIKSIDFSNNLSDVAAFVNSVERTGGGDAPEAYEQVLMHSRSLSWRNGSVRALCVIGDDVPHPPTYPLNTRHVDWRAECGKLREMDIKVYAVQCLNRRYADEFYRDMSRMTDGFHCPLDQFSQMSELIIAVCMKQAGDEFVMNYQQSLQKSNQYNRGLHAIFNALLGTSASVVDCGMGHKDLRSCPAGKFQVLKVGPDRVDIRAFTRDNGLIFKKGKGYYEFTKSEEIQDYKLIVLMDKTTGDLFEGDYARELLDINGKGSVRVSPKDVTGYVVFVQSTSVNRALVPNTLFLYEVDDWDAV